MNILSPMHILLLLVVALLLFGNRLPEVARSIGRALNEFKRGLKDVGDNMNQDPPASPPPASRQSLPSGESQSKPVGEREQDKHPVG